MRRVLRLLSLVFALPAGALSVRPVALPRALPTAAPALTPALAPKAARIDALIESLAATPLEARPAIRAEISALAAEKTGLGGSGFWTTAGVSDAQAARLAELDSEGFEFDGRDKVWNGQDIRLHRTLDGMMPLGYGAGHLLKHAGEFEAHGGVERVLGGAGERPPALSLRSRYGLNVHVYPLPDAAASAAIVVASPDGRIESLYSSRPFARRADPKSLLRTLEGVLDGELGALHASADGREAFLALPELAPSKTPLYLRYTRRGDRLEVRPERRDSLPPGFTRVSSPDGWLEVLTLERLRQGARERVRLDALAGRAPAELPATGRALGPEGNLQEARTAAGLVVPGAAAIAELYLEPVPEHAVHRAGLEGMLRESGLGSHPGANAPRRRLRALERAWRESGRVDREKVSSLLDETLLRVGGRRAWLVAEAALESATAKLPHTFIFPPDSARRLERHSSATRLRFGLRFEPGDGPATVRSVEPDSPAERAGLKPGDVVSSLDKRPTPTAARFHEVFEDRVGETGRYHRLSVTRRLPGREELSFDVFAMAALLKDRTVWHRVLPGGRGYVYVARFSDSTPAEFRTALRELRASGMRELVLDLRYNPGGLVTAAQEMAGFLLPPGSHYQTQLGRDGERRLNAGSRWSVYHDIPVVALINGRSASASEALAGALRAHGRAILAGERSYGKDVGQIAVSLPAGGSMRVTNRRWLLSDGSSAAGGLSPDLPAPAPASPGLERWLRARLEDPDARPVADPLLDSVLARPEPPPLPERRFLERLRLYLTGG